MSLRDRLLVIYTAIFTVAFLLFGVVVYYFPRTVLLSDIDAELWRTAQQMLDETQVFTVRDVPELIVGGELGTFERANTFVLSLDSDGERLNASTNLNDYVGVLDDVGLAEAVDFYNTVSIEDEFVRVLTIPLYVQSGQGQQLVGYLQLGQVIDDFSSFERLLVIALFIGAASVTFALLLVMWLTPNLFRPLEDMAVVARQISRADDLSRRVPDTGRDDEIGDLTKAFNQTLARLENLFRTQQRFLADVSHELRTPLTTIQGNVDLMRRMSMADPMFLDDMQIELERMTRLVNDLLLLARADVGSLPMIREPVDLDTLLFEAFRQFANMAVRTEVDVVLGEVSQARVLGDRDRLKQLMIILVDNGVKYTPAGGKVRLSLSTAEDRAHVIITDTGAGIPEQDLPHIFDRFYRVDKARSRALGGSGLGLSIAKWIAESHRGNIHVTSIVGEGTTFYISLPLLPMPPMPRDEDEDKITTPLPAIRLDKDEG